MQLQTRVRAQVVERECWAGSARAAKACLDIAQNIQQALAAHRLTVLRGEGFVILRLPDTLPQIEEM